MYILYPREDFADQIRLFLGSFLERREGGGVNSNPKVSQNNPVWTISKFPIWCAKSSLNKE